MSTKIDPALAGRIRDLYDSTTSGWVSVWGEHLHHGYYAPGESRHNHLHAQVEMVDKLLEWGGPLEPLSKVLDAGCGVGGSSRHLARKFDCSVVGLTLSPVQRDIAERRSSGETRVSFAVGDATATNFPDHSFDLVWALESAEHMPNKSAFLSEAARLLRPGGKLLAATWCHRSGSELSPKEAARLKAVSDAYGSSLTWVSAEHYRDVFKAHPFTDVRLEDWSDTVKPFWGAVLASALTPKGLMALVSGGLPMLRGAYGGLHMRSGLSSGLVRYVVFTGTKAQ